MKFKFGDRVKVINGFYKMAEGDVISYRGNPLEYFFVGWIKINSMREEIKAWINEKDLSKINKEK